MKPLFWSYSSRNSSCCHDAGSITRLYVWWIHRSEFLRRHRPSEYVEVGARVTWCISA